MGSGTPLATCLYAMDRGLTRHLDVLFPSYAGDRTGLLATLSDEELKRAYKRQALECHPDRGAASERFLRLREAFEALRPHALARSEPETARAPVVIAVGGAKGGIGKSTLSASLASALAALGYRVVATDLDLGGASLHLYLGVRTPATTLGHWSAGATHDLAAAVQPTGTASLSFIAGDASVLGATTITHGRKHKLLRELRRLPTDFVVLDLGGDTGFNTLDFFLAADHRLVVTTADPASVLDAYSFIKVALLRRLTQYVRTDATRPRFAPAAETRLQRFVTECRQPGTESVAALVADLPALDAVAARAVAGVLAEVRPRLVLNLSDPSAGKDVIERIRDTCRARLHIDVDLCHLVPADPRVAHATRRITNVITAGTDGPASQAIWALAQKIAHPVTESATPAVPRRPTVRRRFFDPPTIFAALARVVDDPFRRCGARGELVEAFVFASDAGETAYSVAIALEHAARRTRGTAFHVWAAGLSGDEIETARRGVYPHVFLGALRAETLRDYFLRGTGLSEGFSAVKEGVRRRITFLEGQGLERLPERASLDLAFIDGRAEARGRVERLSFGAAVVARIRPGGLLITSGGVERDVAFAGFQRLDEGIYQALDVVQSRRSVA